MKVIQLYYTFVHYHSLLLLSGMPYFKQYTDEHKLSLLLKGKIERYKHEINVCSLGNQ
jgi:hypothetical protein